MSVYEIHNHRSDVGKALATAAVWGGGVGLVFGTHGSVGIAIAALVVAALATALIWLRDA